MPVVEIFDACVTAIQGGTHIHRQSRRDKEFHFQDWFAARLNSINLNHDDPGRNSYPDFRLVGLAEGYEVKGLAFPGREANYDCNSQVPTGFHNGRQIYYVFGRYPAEDIGEDFPVYDLIICHGSFLNADHDYIHQNKNIKGFGSYGDIMIRDRKMYVCPTPFALTTGTARDLTLILPAGQQVDDRLKLVGDLTRVESSKLVKGYSFDLKHNTLTPTFIANPHAGKEHFFKAYRSRGSPDGAKVTLRPSKITSPQESDSCDEEE